MTVSYHTNWAVVTAAALWHTDTQAGYAPLAGDSATPTYITEAVKCPQNFYCPGGQVSLLMDTANPAPGMQMMPCNVSGIAGLWTQGAGATSIDECSK